MIVMHKVCSDELTTDILSRDFKENVVEFIVTDQAFSFMTCINQFVPNPPFF